MNNEIRHVTWGFGNAWISLSTFSPIGLKETHPQTSNEVMSFEQKKINKAYRPNAHLLYIVMHYNGNII